LISGKDVYNLFDEQSPDDTARFARLVARPGAEFIVATGSKDNAFLKFVLRNLTRTTEVEIVFVMNQFGMPIPFNASTVDGTPIEIHALRLPWEASPKELDQAGKRVKLLIALRKERRAKEKAASEFESMLIRLMRLAPRLEAGQRATVEGVATRYMAWFQDETEDVSIDEYARKTSEVKAATDSIVEEATEAENKPIFLAKLKKTLKKAEEQSEKDGDLLRVIADTKLLLQDDEDDCKWTELRDNRLELKRQMVAAKQTKKDEEEQMPLYL
jgi:hypothetical protein